MDSEKKTGAPSVRALAAVVGMSPSTVQRDRAAAQDYAAAEDGTILVGWTMGVDGKLRPSRRVDTTARDEEVLRLRADGASIRAIAAKLECSPGTVHRVLSHAK